MNTFVRDAVVPLLLRLGLAAVFLYHGFDLVSKDFGAGWNPHYHQPSDRFTSYSDQDFRLGLNTAQTTLSAIARLTGAKLK